MKMRQDQKILRKHITGKIRKAERQLSVFDRHQLAIAKKTLTYSDAGALIMGGPTKREAVDIIYRLTGQIVELS